MKNSRKQNDLEEDTHAKIVNKTNKYIFVFSLLGLILSGYLWYLHDADIIVPCTTGGCHHILTGEYSTMLGIPVATWGAVFYAFMAYISFLRFRIRSMILNAHIAFGALIGLGYTLFLRYIEFVKIGNICSWCWISVLFVLTIFVLTLVENKKDLIKTYKKIL